MVVDGYCWWLVPMIITALYAVRVLVGRRSNNSSYNSVPYCIAILSGLIS